VAPRRGRPRRFDASVRVMGGGMTSCRNLGGKACSGILDAMVTDLHENHQTNDKEVGA